MSEHKYYDIHFFEYFPVTNSSSLPTEFLLESAINCFNFSSSIEKDIHTIKSINGCNSTLWGIKNEGNIFSIEYYFYFKKKYPQNSIENLISIFSKYSNESLNPNYFDDNYFLISINPKEDKIEGFNIYFPVVDLEYPIFKVDELGFIINAAKPIEISQFYSLKNQQTQDNNTYYGIRNLGEMSVLFNVFNKLHENLFPNEKIEYLYDVFKLPYLNLSNETRNVGVHLPSGIAQKLDCIGLYFTALDVNQFLGFLEHHNYSNEYIEKIKKNRSRLNHIRFDIGIDIQLKCNRLIIKKSSFYGTF